MYYAVSGSDQNTKGKGGCPMPLLKRLLIVDLYVSDRCSRNCWYCEFAHTRRGLLMDMAAFGHALNLVEQWKGYLQLQLSGTGEPLENPRLPEMAEMVTRSNRFPSLLYTSGCASEEELARLRAIVPTANRLLPGRRGTSIELFLKYDGTPESAERVERTLTCRFRDAKLSVQTVAAASPIEIRDQIKEAFGILVNAGYHYVGEGNCPFRVGPSLQWERDGERMAVVRNTILPVGCWATSEPHVEVQDVPESWTGDELPYWALHADGIVGICEHDTRGFVPVTNYTRLKALHADLQQLRQRYHNRRQMVDPHVCNMCPVHLGTAKADP